jgi:hypothetical protein
MRRAGRCIVITKSDGEFQRGGAGRKQLAIRETYELAIQRLPRDRETEIRPYSGRFS